MVRATSSVHKLEAARKDKWITSEGYEKDPRKGNKWEYIITANWATAVFGGIQES